VNPALSHQTQMHCTSLIPRVNWSTQTFYITSPCTPR